MLSFLEPAVPTLIVIGLILLGVVIFSACFYKVARVDQALIITGGRRPKIKVSGGGVVIPIFRRYSYFDLCMITVEATGDEIKTTTGTPIVVNWTAQIRPNAGDTKQLLAAATSFLERGSNGIRQDVKLTLDGGVREVVAAMTPAQVLREKDAFSTRIKESVAEEMKNMGFILVSLNIQDVTDSYGYFDNLAAEDKETKRQEAAQIKAMSEQAIRQKVAETDQLAKETELQADLAVAEEQRKVSLRKSAIQTETDTARADAEIAGQLQATIRKEDLTIKEGQVEVARQEQANLAAQKRMAVAETEAMTERKTIEIAAQAAAQQAQIKAEADAAVVKRAAEASADAVRAKAEGEANAKKALANAEAAQINLTGQAEADVIRQKGEAEAGAVKARMLAEAEGERALADARAANDGVNFKVTVAEIEAKARIEIATATAKVMADIGANARFVNFGGGKTQLEGGTGNVLFDTLMDVPALLEKLSVANQAVTPDGKDFNKTLNELVTSVVSPLGVLNKEKTVVSEELLPGQAGAQVQGDQEA